MSDIETGVEEWAMDKSEWGEGPWVDEPDRKEWRYRGLPCLMVRSHLGNWCGYVGVPPGHPWHGKNFDDVDVRVHGGLTYSDSCRGQVCHVALPGDPDDVWWLGFDCCHAEDLAPGMQALLRKSRERDADLARLEEETEAKLLAHDPDMLRILHGTYRDLLYVEAEVGELAEQAVAAAR